jgi:hypothetical protein
LRTVEAHRHDIEGALPHLVADRPFDAAADPAAVITGRVERRTQ